MNNEPRKPSPVKLFYSFAPEDEQLCKRLEKHLGSLRQQGIIEEWYYRKITPGTDWASTIDDNLMAASIILLLISSDFLSSDYCYSIEMQRALQQHTDGNAHVIPIILRPVDWQGAPFAKLKCLPSDAPPVTSWSNQDEGFLDVAKGIREVAEEFNSKQGTNHALSNKTSIDSLSLWNVPFRRNPFFTGREEVLSKLHKAFKLAAIDESRTFALTGLGGVGKTQTAIEYAYRYRGEYKTIVWVQAETRETLELDLCRIAGILGLPEQNEKDQSIVIQAVKRWLETQVGWLLILDNADDLGMVSNYLPLGNRGCILLTTRAQTMAGLAYKIEIEELGFEEGSSFLLQRAGISTPDFSHDKITLKDSLKAREIVQEMGGLPLALDQAGAYIEETKCSLSRYLTIYRAKQTKLLGKRGGIAATHPESVATTWSLSFQNIEQSNPIAAEILQFCAFLAPDAIPEEIFTEGGPALGQIIQATTVDSGELDIAIGELLKYSLVRRDPQNGMLTVHRLVQTVIKESMDDTAQRQWAERVVQILNHIFPITSFETLSACQRLLSHIQMCEQLIYRWNIDLSAATELLNRGGHYLDLRAQYNQSLHMFQHALDILERAQRPRLLEIAAVLHNIASAYRGQGKSSQALTFYQRALAIREQILGPQHPDVAHSLNNLATLYTNEKLYTLALPFYQRALAIREQVLGSQHPDVAHSLSNLATLYRNQKQYNEAEPLYQRALAINEEAFGQNHPYVAAVLNNLATLYLSQKKYNKATPLYHRALIIYEQILGRQHPYVATILKNLAILSLRQEKYIESETFFKQALAIYEEVLGKEHHSVATTLDNYAILLRKIKRNDEAAQLVTQSKLIRVKTERIRRSHSQELE